MVDDKAPRVASYHRNTLGAIAQVIGAAGLAHPADLQPWHIHMRSSTGEVVRGDVAYPKITRGALLTSDVDDHLKHEWDRASADSFMPQF